MFAAKPSLSFVFCGKEGFIGIGRGPVTAYVLKRSHRPDMPRSGRSDFKAVGDNAQDLEEERPFKIITNEEIVAHLINHRNYTIATFNYKAL